VISAGPSNSTPLTVSLDLNTGVTTSLYVAAPGTELRSGPAGGTASNADLSITQGVTLSGAFAGVGTAITPNVELGYGVCN
jgi:hypothetical protein